MPATPDRVRLQLVQPLDADLLARDAVGLAALQDRVHRPQILRLAGDDDLAADLIVDAVLVAERLHHRLATAAVDGLHAAGLVVNAAVQHAAVVAGLVVGERLLLFEDDDLLVGVAGRQLVRGGEADDAAADDGDVDECGSGV